MDYFKNVKKSFLLTWKHKFLIGLGILATFATGSAGSNFNISIPGGGGSGEGDWDKYFQDTSGEVGRVLGESTGSFNQFIADNVYWLALIGLVLLAAFIVLWVYGVFANAGLICSIVKLEKGKSSSFKDGIGEGKKYFWKSVGYFLLIGLAAFVLIAVLAGIAVGFFFLSVVLGIIWSILAFLFLIIALIYISLIARFWIRVIVIEEMKVFPSLSESIKFFNQRFKTIIIVWLINLVINIVYVVAVMIAIFILAIPLVLIALGVGCAAGLVAGIIVGALFALVLVAASLILAGYYNALISVYWTLSYLDLRKIKIKKSE